MAASSDETRQRILDAALVEFAAQGIHHASLLEITRRAGQRNRGAVHYHFGSREGLLVAVMETQAEILADRERELLGMAEGGPDDDLRSALEAIARPVVELAETGWRGACYLRIADQIVSLDPATVPPGVQEVIASTSGAEIYALISKRMPGLPGEIRTERLLMATTFMLQAVAARARLADTREHGRPQLDTEPFLANLLDMVTGMLSAPVGHEPAA